MTYIPARGIFTAEGFRKLSLMGAEYRPGDGPLQFDMLSIDESWFYIKDFEDLEFVVSHHPLLIQGFWSKPGWYKTTLRHGYGTNWLVLERSNAENSIGSRAKLINEDAARFKAFVEHHNLNPAP